MDLENLKSEWLVMNNRMDKQEIFNEKMYCQMLNAKSDKSLSRLIKYEIINVIASVLLIPVSFYMFRKIPNFGTETEFARSIVISLLVLSVICAIWYGFKFLILSKIDFIKTLKNNLLYINKYSIYTKYEKLIGYYVLCPFAIIINAIFYAKIHASLFLWIFMLCMFIAIIFLVIYLYRLSNKHISTIQQNLEELRDLEEQ